MVRKRGDSSFRGAIGHIILFLGLNFYACPPGLYKFNYPYQPSEHHIPERKMAFLFRLVRSCFTFFSFVSLAFILGKKLHLFLLVVFLLLRVGIL